MCAFTAGDDFDAARTPARGGTFGSGLSDALTSWCGPVSLYGDWTGEPRRGGVTSGAEPECEGALGVGELRKRDMRGAVEQGRASMSGCVRFGLVICTEQSSVVASQVSRLGVVECKCGSDEDHETPSPFKSEPRRRRATAPV